MNTQNIQSLTEQLTKLGFENSGYLLAKKSCFKLRHFLLDLKIKKGKDRLFFQLFFEKESSVNGYVLKYYDAVFQKEIAIADLTIHGIHTITLEKSMQVIDWKKAFDFTTVRQGDPEENEDWEIEEKIELVMEGLAELERSAEGKLLADSLKWKYWADSSYQGLVGTISPLKDNAAISQRFYFQEGETGISVDEAWRFLQNRWLEKLLQAKKKQSGTEASTETGDERKAASGKGLLQKKGLKKTPLFKSNKPIA